MPTAVDESSLANSWNVAIPASAIQPGCSVIATLGAGVTWPASIVLFITGSSCLAIGGQAFRAFGPKPPPDDVA